MAPEPVTPRPAATAIVMRRGGRHRERGLELLLLERGAEAKFMPGVWVFAGGVVEGDDRGRPGRQPGTSDDEWAHRVCGARELGEEGGVELGPGALLPWSRWVTPEPLPYRFDTRFYVALAPPHCKPVPDGVEMSQARWISPGAALAAGERDQLELSFPTIRHLEQLAGYADADAVLVDAAERDPRALTPRIRRDGDEVQVLLPGEAGYEDAD